MSVEAKICGVSDMAAIAAAAAGGATYIGLNFYPPSPRAVSPDQAAALTGQTPRGLKKVGVFVTPDDALLTEITTRASLDILQLHGGEDPRRVAEVRARFGLPVMKAIRVSGPEDLEAVETFGAVADLLMFDAKPPKSLKNALPGGNAVAFDWRILAGRAYPKPWLLAGGLATGNLAEAVSISGAETVDVSSGVEDEPGRKSPAKITDFLDRARTL